MSVKVGLDFGTTNSAIAFFDQDDRASLFCMDPDKPTYYIPSKVFYPKKGNPVIGHAARHFQAKNITGQQGELIEYFKMFLPLGETRELEKYWPHDKTPYEVSKDYLSILLDNFRKEHGHIEKVVCSVPELWQRDLGHQQDRLISNYGTRQLNKILKELGIEASFLCSEPVCAAAYYAYNKKMEKQPFNGTLLVCDPGGGTFDVALCRVTDNKIEVLTFEGSGLRGLESAGVAFDRNVVQQVSRENSDLDQKLKDIHDSRMVEWAFENEKHLDVNNENIARAMQEYPDLEDTAYQFFFENNTYEVTYRQVWQAFRPIAVNISNTLQNIQDWCKSHDETIDRVIIVGGFGRFPLVQNLVKRFFDWEDTYYDEEFNERKQVVHSVALGAGVIAVNKNIIVEKYPHTIGIDTDILEEGLLKNIELDILASGDYVVGSGPKWATGTNGSPLIVEVDQDGVNVDRRLWIKKEDAEKHYLDVKLTTPKAGKYYVGAKVGRDYQAELLFQNAETGTEKNMPLG